MTKNNVYELVTKTIIEKLEKGVVPWRKPWTNANAVNWVTQKPYSGINTMLLDPGEYASFLQIKTAGGKVKKGEKGQMVVFYKPITVEDKESGKEKIIPYLEYTKVFEINSQVEGLSTKRTTETFEHNPIEEGEKIFKGYMNAPTYSFKPGKASYSPSRDHINVPPLKDFKIADEYYSTLFHEMVHSSGAKGRMNRTGIVEFAGFGSDPYGREELIAEMGASILCGMAGIDNSTIDNSASYIQSWLRALKEPSNTKLVIQASGQAKKATDFILGVQYLSEEKSA